MSDSDLTQFQKAACCSSLWSLSIIAAIPIGYGLLSNTEATLDDIEFQSNCINLYDANIDIQSPNDIEFTILNWCTFCMTMVMIFMCCVAMFCKDSDNVQTASPCCGCILLLAAFGASAMFLHIFIYMYLLNQEFKELSPLTCYVDDDWEEAYQFALAGGCVGSSIVVLFCCICYLLFGAINSASDDTNNTTAAAPSATRASTANDTRTVAIRTNNDKNYDLGASDTQLTEAQRALVGGIISLGVIDKLGFSIATTVNKVILRAVLQSIKPEGQTALRDAIALSIMKMVALKAVLDDIGVIGHQFIHIVLTDGADNKSSTSLTDIQDLYKQIGSSIGKKYFKTYFIGIDLGYTEKRELQSIADLAGDAADLENCNDVQISDVFDRIKLSLGIQRRIALVTDGNTFVGASSDRLYLQAERQKFLVLFDLDMSGSMSGNRWIRLQEALSSFFNGLDDSDIIGCVLFNHEAKCITGEVLSNAINSLG